MLTRVLTQSQMPDLADFILGQILHCVEQNSNQLPGVCMGGGMGSFGIKWYITWGAKLLRSDRKAFKGTAIFELEMKR